MGDTLVSVKDYNFDGKRVLLIGPMPGEPGFNRVVFDEAAARLNKLWASHVYSHIPVYPYQSYMLMTLSSITTWTWELEKGVPTPTRWYDCIVFLPGWEQSEGAKVGKAVAEACGIECVEWGEGL